MFNRKVLGALASVVALLLLLQAAFVIVLSIMTYAGNPVNLDPSVTQALALLQQLGTVAFIYVVLGAAARLATKKHGYKCERCPNCEKCLEDCSCEDGMMPTYSAPKKSTAKKSASKSSAKKSTTRKKSSSRAKKK